MKGKMQKVLRIVLSMGMGAGMALCVVPWSLAHFIDASLWLFELSIFAGLLAALPCYVVMIAAHEAGHLLAGLKSGYSFVSYRIMSVVLIRQNGRLRLKRYSLAGTAGQCLLKPPAWTEHGIPMQLYHWGGVLMNAVLALLLLPGLFAVPQGSFGAMLLRLLVVLNVFGALMNGIPTQCNDGDNALHLVHDLTAQRAFWSQMMAHALIAEGMPLAEIPEELYALPEDADLTNPLIAATAANRAQLPLYHRRFEEADAAIADLLARAGKALPPVIRFLMVEERVWYELMHENRSEVLDALRDKEFARMEKAMQRSVSVIRVQYTQALADGDRSSAEKLLKRMEQVACTYPYPQEVAEEQEMIRLADEHFRALQA